MTTPTPEPDPTSESSDTSTEGVEAPGEGGMVVAAVAGIAAIGVSMAARPVLNALYRRVSGHEPPRAEDPQVPFARALVWTVLSAATGAVLELIVQRTTRRVFVSSD